MKNELKRTAHSSYRCEYHIVFAPKYRRKVIYKELRKDIGDIFRYGSRNFWCRGYYVDTVGKNARIIQEYIKNQLEEDFASDQISIKEYTDPFTGKRV